MGMLYDVQTAAREVCARLGEVHTLGALERAFELADDEGMMMRCSRSRLFGGAWSIQGSLMCAGAIEVLLADDLSESEQLAAFAAALAWAWVTHAYGPVAAAGPAAAMFWARLVEELLYPSGSSTLPVYDARCRGDTASGGAQTGLAAAG